MNGTVTRSIAANQSECAAACSAQTEAQCAAFVTPDGPNASVCHLLRQPLVEWFGGAEVSPCRCAVRDYAGGHWEGPGENDVVRLKDGTLLSVFRVDSCAPYWHSRSSDAGLTWSPPAALSKDVNGSARPKLLLLPNGQPLLSGGRPGLFLWLGDLTATHWTALNVAAIHNTLTRDEPAWQYAPGFIDGSAVGAPCAPVGPAGGQRVPAGTTSYASLLQTGPGQFLLECE